MGDLSFICIYDSFDSNNYEGDDAKVSSIEGSVLIY
jgi:hypothetical protein